jgi:tetrahydromethanopterin S-methyltransferase subunit C
MKIHPGDQKGPFRSLLFPIKVQERTRILTHFCDSVATAVPPITSQQQKYFTLCVCVCVSVCVWCIYMCEYGTGDQGVRVEVGNP